MHVLLVSSLYPPYVAGGAEMIVAHLAKCLVEKGHRVTVVSSCGAAERQSRTLQDGVDVWRFFPPNLWWLYDRSRGEKRSAAAVVAWRLRDVWNTKAARHFGAILDATRPDVVHTHYTKGFSASIWLEAKRRSIPILHTAHAYELICASGSMMRVGGRNCERRCLTCRLHGGWYAWQTRLMTVFCSPSRFLLKAHQEAGVKPRRFALVRNGTPRPMSTCKRGAAPDAPVRFLYLGQLTEHKGIRTLLAAVAHLKSVRFTLDIAGTGPLEPMIRELARSDSRIRPHGFVQGPDKENLLRSCQVLVFPSLWVENAPVTIAEAFTCGLPVIATDLGASPEFVQHEVNGLLFPRADAQALAVHMSELATDPDRLERLQKGADASGRALSTVNDMADEYLVLYETTLQEEQR